GPEAAGRRGGASGGVRKSAPAAGSRAGSSAHRPVDRRSRQRTLRGPRGSDGRAGGVGRVGRPRSAPGRGKAALRGGGPADREVDRAARNGGPTSRKTAGASRRGAAGDRRHARGPPGAGNARRRSARSATEPGCEGLPGPTGQALVVVSPQSRGELLDG